MIWKPLLCHVFIMHLLGQEGPTAGQVQLAGSRDSRDSRISCKGARFAEEISNAEVLSRNGGLKGPFW